MATGGTAPATSAPEVFYEVAMQRLSEQIGRLTRLDSKTATVFTFASAILPVFGGLLTLSDRTLPSSSIALFVLGLLIYGALLWFSYQAYQVRWWSFRPELETLKEHSKRSDELVMKWWVAEECSRSVKTNEPMIAKKTRNLFLAIALLPAEALVLSLAALLSLT